MCRILAAEIVKMAVGQVPGGYPRGHLCIFTKYVVCQQGGSALARLKRVKLLIFRGLHSATNAPSGRKLFEFQRAGGTRERKVSQLICQSHELHCTFATRVGRLTDH